MRSGPSTSIVASHLTEATSAVPETVLAPEPAPARVLVYNDHPVFKSALSWKLAQGSGVEFIADSVSLSQTIQLASEFEGYVDAVVADLRIGDGNSEGLESIRVLSARLKMPVIALTDYYSRAYVARLTESGAAAVVQKSASMDELGETIRSAVRHSDGADSEANGNAA